MPTEDDGTRTDVLLGQNMISCTALRARLRRAPARRRRGSSSPPAPSPKASWPIAAPHAVAERLGTTPVIFPSDHGGFLGGEYGQTGEPDEFAAKLREVLGDRA